MPIATVTGARLMMVPKLNVDSPGVSTTFTGMPSFPAATAKASASSPSRAPIAIWAPLRSSAVHDRATTSIEPAGGDRCSVTSSAVGCGAYMWTFPPAAAASSAFHTAPSPSPATTTLRPFKSRNTGSAASGVMRAGRVSVGGTFEVISHHGMGWREATALRVWRPTLAYSAASGMAGRAADNMRFISGTQEPQLVPALQASPTSSAVPAPAPIAASMRLRPT